MDKLLRKVDQFNSKEELQLDEQKIDRIDEAMDKLAKSAEEFLSKVEEDS